MGRSSDITSHSTLRRATWRSTGERHPGGPALHHHRVHPADELDGAEREAVAAVGVPVVDRQRLLEDDVVAPVRSTAATWALLCIMKFRPTRPEEFASPPGCESSAEASSSAAELTAPAASTNRPASDGARPVRTLDDQVVDPPAGAVGDDPQHPAPGRQPQPGSARAGSMAQVSASLLAPSRHGKPSQVAHRMQPPAGPRSMPMALALGWTPSARSRSARSATYGSWRAPGAGTASCATARWGPRRWCRAPGRRARPRRSRARGPRSRTARQGMCPRGARRRRSRARGTAAGWRRRPWCCRPRRSGRRGRTGGRCRRTRSRPACTGARRRPRAATSSPARGEVARRARGRARRRRAGPARARWSPRPCRSR